MNKYEDIIKLNRPISKHPKMKLYDRAAQFAAFAALTTHGEEIEEINRYTDKKIELSEEEINDINDKLIYISEHIKDNIKVEITYFIKDNKKEGGKYKTIKTTIKKIDTYNKNIILDNNNKIKLYNIIKIIIL